jgi:hypothetical protein
LVRAPLKNIFGFSRGDSVSESNEREVEYLQKEKALKKLFLGSIFIPVLIFILIVPSEDGKQTSPVDLAVLSTADKTDLTEILHLKDEFGDKVWPGLGRMDIPIILYNERYEFLVGQANPPPPWQVVKGDSFLGRAYHRRPAENPQAFAVAVGTRWAASGGTLELMNRKIPFRLSREFHAVIVLHEVFHAFQAARAPQHFTVAVSVYKFEGRYPYEDPEFSSAWNSEGAALAGALAAKDESTISGLVQKFLDIRKARRRQIDLDSELISYEQELEWLEGLSKYAEIRFFEFAASRANEAAYANYRSGHPFWPMDLARLRRNLGGQEGDLRFYLSGVAQAMLLDRLDPRWKDGAFEESANLDDRLRAAVFPID